MATESLELDYTRLASSQERARTFEKRSVDKIEHPEYETHKQERNRADIEMAREQIVAAQSQLIKEARAHALEQSATLESDRETTQQRIDQIKEVYGMAQVARELSSYASAVWSLIPGSRANTAARIWEAQELVYESALEPSKLERAQIILSQLEARNN